MESVDVIIVGAGISGLSAAVDLKTQGFKVLVLESSNRVGGRLETCIPREGEPQYGWTDMGGSFITSAQTHVMSLCNDLDMKTYQSPWQSHLNGINYFKGKRQVLNDIVPNIWWSNPVAALEIRLITNYLEQMCWEIPAEKPWEAQRAKEWDNISLKDFFAKHCWTEFAYEYLCGLCVTEEAADPSEISLLFFLWMVRQANGPGELWGESETEVSRIMGGSETLPRKLAQKLGNSIVLNSPVFAMEYNSNGVSVQTLKGSTFNAKYAILATPPNTQLKIHFDPPLLLMRSSLLQRSFTGHVMKCQVFYSERFWENIGLNAYVKCTDGLEIVNIVVDDNKPGVKIHGLSCFILSHHVISLSEMSDKQREGAVCKAIAKYFNSDVALKPVHFVYKVWLDTSGGLVCNYQLGALTSFGQAIRKPIGQRIFLAGTETATHFAGYIDGAIDAGQRAAREVLHAFGLIKESEVWIQKPSPIHHTNTREKIINSVVFSSYWKSQVLQVLGIAFLLLACLLL